MWSTYLVDRPLRPVDDQGVQLGDDQLEGVPGFAADNRAGGHAPPDRLQAAHELADASGNT